LATPFEFVRPTLRFQPGILILAAWSLLSGGCGLSDYEERMNNTRKKLDAFELSYRKEKQYLAGPLVLPTEKRRGKDGNWIEEQELPFDIFLRPPLGIRTETPKQLRFKLLYQYEGSSPGILRVFLAATTDQKKTSKVFAGEVIAGVRGTFDNQEPGLEEKETLEGKKLKFEVYSYQKGSPSSRFLFYFYRDESRQVAIGYQLPEQGDFRDAIDASLKSLEFDHRAAHLRELFADEKRFYKFRLTSQFPK
jgi:hypothetical protein